LDEPPAVEERAAKASDELRAAKEFLRAIQVGGALPATASKGSF